MWENSGLLLIFTLVVLAFVVVVRGLLKTKTEGEPEDNPRREEFGGAHYPPPLACVCDGGIKSETKDAVKLPEIPANKSLVVGEWLIVARPQEHYFGQHHLSSMDSDYPLRYWKVNSKDVFSNDSRNIGNRSLRALLDENNAEYTLVELSCEELYKLEMWGLNSNHVDVTMAIAMVEHWVVGVGEYVDGKNTTHRELRIRQGVRIDKRRHKLFGKIYQLEDIRECGPKTRSWTLMCYLKGVEIEEGQSLNAVAERDDGKIFKIDQYDYISEAEFNQFFETAAFNAKVDLKTKGT